MKASLRKEFNAPELQYRKRQELHGIKQNMDPISTYLARLEKHSQNLNVTDQTKLDIMIAGLDPKYRQYIQMKQPRTYSDATHALLLKESVSPPKSDDIIRHVLETVQSIKENQNRGPENKGAERNDRSYQQYNGGYRRDNRQRFETHQERLTRPGTTPTCYYCGKMGHVSKNCRRKLAAEARTAPLRYSPKTESPKYTSRPKAEVTCFKCNKKGHYARDCFTIKRE